MIQTASIRVSYKFYKNNVEGQQVPENIYLKIAGGYMKFLVQKLLDGFQVQLSGGNSFGIIAIVGKKMKLRIDENGEMVGGAVDWKTTNLLWARDEEARRKKTLIRHTNGHSAGYKYNFVWWQTGMKIGNKHLYSFTSSKMLSRAISKKIKIENKEYLTHT